MWRNDTKNNTPKPLKNTAKHRKICWCLRVGIITSISRQSHISPRGKNLFPRSRSEKKKKYSKNIRPCSFRTRSFFFSFSTLFPFSFSLLSLPKRRSRRRRKWLYSLIFHSFFLKLLFPFFFHFWKEEGEKKRFFFLVSFLLFWRRKRREREKEERKYFLPFLKKKRKKKICNDIVFPQKCVFGLIFGIKLGIISRKTPKNRCKTAKSPPKLNFLGKLNAKK